MPPILTNFIDPNAFSTQDLPGLIRNLINIALLLAPVIGVIYIIVAGFKYITAGGNAERAMEARNTILQVIIGLVIVFASYAIVQFVLNLLVK